MKKYANSNSFSIIDQVKRQIIKLYEEDFKKIDPSGRLSAMYHSIPAQLSKDVKRYRVATALCRRKTSKDEADKLPANLGYLYENVVAQMLTASGRELYYHTWEKEGSTHYYEIDFLISQGAKVSAIEVKSAGIGKHESLMEFRKRYSKHIKDCYIISQKDIDRKDNLRYLPVYMTSFLGR